jgi:hypothetical protein
MFWALLVSLKTDLILLKRQHCNKHKNNYNKFIVYNKVHEMMRSFKINGVGFVDLFGECNKT